MQGIRRSKSNQDEVFQLWKREKDKIIKQKKVFKSEKDSGNKEDKKASAQKVSSELRYLTWNMELYHNNKN